ncbi:MAG: right-handed parallel beta-helix repeat-containing protein, partial [Minisyncoccales bacterium]
MLKRAFFSKPIILLTISLLLFAWASFVQAADCGNATSCQCGDTVVAPYTLTNDLECGASYSFGLKVAADLTLEADIIMTGPRSHGLWITASGTAADPITIDGNNHTIRMVNGTNLGYQNWNYYGIKTDNSLSYLYIKNLTVTNFERGIDFYGTSSSTIESVTANANTFAGIALTSSQHNSLINNTANFNDSYGIYFWSNVMNNYLEGNIMEENHSLGFYSHQENNCYNNVLRNNAMNNNGFADIAAFATSSKPIDDIDNSNTVDNGKPVYYLYQAKGTADNPIVYDFNNEEIGLFLCVGCEYVHLKNAVFTRQQEYAPVSFYNTSSSTIENVKINKTAVYAIYLNNSDNNTITNNIINSAFWGIYLYLSDNNLISNNQSFYTRHRPLFLSSSTNNIYLSNQANHTFNNSLTFASYPPPLYSLPPRNLNETIEFEIAMLKPGGTPCSDCQYEVFTSPAETVTTTQNGNNLTSSFTPHRPGFYSLIYRITDGDNVTTRKFSFLVNPVSTSTQRYYLRHFAHDNITGLNNVPVRGHGQQSGFNGGVLSSEPSTKIEWLYDHAHKVVQDTLDEIPPFPLANISEMTVGVWYKQNFTTGAYLGLERFPSMWYIAGGEATTSVAQATTYTWFTHRFTNLNWTMDYLWSWYWLNTRLYGELPAWITFPSLDQAASSSYVDISYYYTTTPAVRSVTNDHIIVLSSTANPDNYDLVSLVLENPFLEATSSEIVLDDFNNAFLGAVA